MKIFGIKQNKCLQQGLQGVCSQYLYENTSGSSVFFSFNNPEINARYVFKEYTGGVIGEMPTVPTPDFNFHITLKQSSGFNGTLNGLITYAYTNTSSTDPEHVKVYYDNPTFDPTDNYTVIHFHIWYDGVNYCGHVDGYVEATT